MDNQKRKIPPDKEFVTFLLVCLIGSIFLLFNKPTSHGSRYVPPEFLLLSGLYLLYLEWRNIFLCKDAIYVQYLPTSIKRKIMIDRISHIEYVEGKHQPFMLITLERCPTFSESKCKKVESYIFLHPLRVIGIRCSETNKNSIELYFKELMEQKGTKPFCDS